MNLSNFCIIFLFFLFLPLLSSQSPLEIYEKESIYLTPGGFVKNGEKQRVVFSYRPLKKAMKSSPAARLEYKKYSEKRKTATILSIVGLTSLISAIAVEDLDLQRGLILGGLGATIATIPFSTKAAKHLHKSVWTYNRDLLLPK